MAEINPLTAAVEGTFGDLANASGNMQAIKDGVVYTHLWAGVTRGAGNTQSVQAATAAGIQAAWNYAAANNFSVKTIPGTYEIYSSTGLTTPFGGAVGSLGWVHDGSQGVNFVQFYVNAPILTIGDPTGANFGNGTHFQGCRLNYGVSQTGQANAVALFIGAATGIVVANISVCDFYGTNPPWIALRINGGSGANNFYFQNALRDIGLGGAQQSLFSLETQGTGNEWDNIYTHDGSNNSSRITCAGPAWSIQPTSAQASDNDFSRCNIEHVNSNAIVQCQGVIGGQWNAPHIEDVQITGNNAGVITLIGGDLGMTELYVLDLAVASGASNPQIIQCAGYGETVHVDGMNIKWSGYSNGIVAVLTSIAGPADNYGTDSNPRVTIDRLRVEDDAGNNITNLRLDPILGNTGLGSGCFIGRYKWDNFLPTTDGFQMVVGTSCTIYGLHANVWLNIPYNLAANITIGLSNKVKASGRGSGEPTPINQRIAARREDGGTITNTATITDLAGSTTLATLSAAGDFAGMFNGTNWIAEA